MKRSVAYSILIALLSLVWPAMAQGQEGCGYSSSDLGCAVSLQPILAADRVNVDGEGFPSPFVCDTPGERAEYVSGTPSFDFSTEHSESSTDADSLHHRTVMAVKTNLLYDALSLVNLSVEFPMGKQFSALVYGQFPWWRWGEARNEYCLRFLSLGGEVRWWVAPRPRPATVKRLERDRMVGHFLGVYAESGMWDFQRQRAICHQGEFWSVGLSYGYSVAVGRRVNMEFSLSVGYASIPYRGYTPSEDYEILWREQDKSGRWGYFGPTKAQISLIVPITSSKGKGGSR